MCVEFDIGDCVQAGYPDITVWVDGVGRITAERWCELVDEAGEWIDYSDIELGPSYDGLIDEEGNMVPQSMMLRTLGGDYLVAIGDFSYILSDADDALDALLDFRETGVLPDAPILVSDPPEGVRP
jgi:hypothetical protein